MTKWFWAVLMAVMVSCGYGNVYIYQGFDFADGKAVSGEYGGIGLGGAWRSKALDKEAFMEQVAALELGLDASAVIGSAHALRAGEMERSIKLPLNPAVEMTYYFSCFFRRDDEQNTLGSEMVDFVRMKNQDGTVWSIQAGSDEKLRLVLGGKEVPSDFSYDLNKTYFLLGKLVAAPEGENDVLCASVYELDKLPTVEPEKWMARCENEVDSVAESIGYVISKNGGVLRIDEIKLTSSLAEALPFAGLEKKLNPEPTYHKVLRFADDALHPLNTGFSEVSILPITSGDVMDVVITSDRGNDYARMNSALHKFVKNNDQRQGYPSLAGNYVYDGGCEFNRPETQGYYTAIKNKDGQYDLIDVPNMIYYVNNGQPGKADYSHSYEIPMKYRPKYDSTNFVADIDGDGVVDLLMSVYNRRLKFNYYPTTKGPWSSSDQPDMGPSDDYENVGPAEGYDVDGNWLGNRLKSVVHWAKGYYDSEGRLCFAKMNKVFQGLDHYPLQWFTWRGDSSAAFLEIGDDKYIITAGDTNTVYALEILTFEGGLCVGKPQPLLATGKIVDSTHLARFIFVGDMNGDDELELVMRSGADGRITLLKGSAVGQFRDMGSFCELGGYVAADTLTTPCRGDWDGDGYEDIVMGDASGYLWLAKGTDDTLVYGSAQQFSNDDGVIRFVPGLHKSIQGPFEQRWGYTQPTLGDWDGDGQLEMISNDSSANVYLHRRTADTLKVESTVFTIDGKQLPIAWRSRPAILSGEIGFAGDERACMLYLDADGQLAVAVPESKGSSEIARSVKLKNYKDKPFRLCGPYDGFWGRTKMAVADWDGDGVWDVLYGTHSGSRYHMGEMVPHASMYFMKNIGTATEPIFQNPVLIKLKNGDVIKVGTHNLSVWPTDLNNDGQLDLISGEELGRVLYWYREDLQW